MAAALAGFWAGQIGSWTGRTCQIDDWLRQEGLVRKKTNLRLACKWLWIRNNKEGMEQLQAEMLQDRERMAAAGAATGMCVWHQRKKSE